MERYNWQKKDWPEFSYILGNVEDDLFLFTEKAGKVTGILNTLPENTRMEAIKTSEIEGEYLSRKDVMFSIRKNLGLVTSLEYNADRKAEGIGE